MHQILALAVVTATSLHAHFPHSESALLSAVKADESGKASGLPDWLRVSGSMRLRYEDLDGQFRANPALGERDNYFVLRTLLRMDADFDPLGVTLEGIDSRQEGADQGSQINTTIVNTLDILQANLRVSLSDGSQEFKLGRFTMDKGSRRLVARNRFRNTINAFDGGAWTWHGEGGSELSLFYTLPVNRRPSDRAELLDNDQEFDDQDTDYMFYGAYFETETSERTQFEAYLYGLDDDRAAPRDYHTPGFRVKADPGKGAVDYEVESAVQFGDSGAEDHMAWFGHASVGYTFDTACTPRVRLAWDYASGDRDPNDNDSNRFNTLFGARRFEYGPTGIYGAVARSNLNSPELRLTLKPCEKASVMTALRGIWLAESQDTWVAAGLRDPTGAAGDHVGEQLEARFRYDVVPKSLRVEVGGAYLFAGSFQERAPGGRGQDTAYGYVQLAWSF